MFLHCVHQPPVDIIIYAVRSRNEREPGLQRALALRVPTYKIRNDVVAVLGKVIKPIMEIHARGGWGLFRGGGSAYSFL